MVYVYHTIFIENIEGEDWIVILGGAVVLYKVFVHSSKMYMLECQIYNLYMGQDLSLYLCINCF